ncbi:MULTISPECIES: antitoxin [Tsukamurella]|uniref:Antitoxin n=2 Tax=Tsukamurella TaxID=2060 RepID=A0A5C5RVQ9_9ACTN|nr:MULTISPECIES: antitoxin [Tsukamurella]NMD54043.1 antitoxin [Tsukamurella columbiensis]TWS27126.1 antitoxin [Tsukamurella conjunctivitidis]
MALLDKIKELLGKNPDQVNKVIDKAGDAAKGKFAGHEDKIDQAVHKVKDVAGGGRTAGDTPPAGGEPNPGTPPPNPQG